MVGDQKFTVNVSFTFEAPVFEGDPTDLFELADLEERSIVTILDDMFEGFDLDEIKVVTSAAR